MQKFFPNSLVMLLAKLSSPTVLISQLLAKAGAVKNKKKALPTAGTSSYDRYSACYEMKIIIVVIKFRFTEGKNIIMFGADP
jgi:hypothetical protein